MLAHGAKLRLRATATNQPSERDQISFSQLLDLYRNSPESGELQCKPGLSKTAISRHSEGWWESRGGRRAIAAFTRD